ncbi:type II toxin-antitoxin system ribonuclease VapC29 [soil metagenome]
MTVLLDANVLIALVVEDHMHHDPAEAWFTGAADLFATCPITQGSLVRLLVRQGASADQAIQVITSLASREGHEFWADDLAYDEVAMTGVIGHRQVSDAYLAALTRRRGGRLATFDEGLASLHPDVATLVPA